MLNYKRQAKIKLYTLSLLCVGIGVGLLWLNTFFNWQSDWTYGSRNTLNASSIDLLKRMPETLEVSAFFDSNNQTRLHVKRFIEKYQRFKQDIRFQFVDTQLPSEHLNQLGFTQFGQLKISYQDKSAFINRLNEKAMTKALFQLARKQDTWIAVVQGHGERDPFDSSNNGMTKVVAELNKTGANVQTINLSEQGFIPDNTQVLMIVGPRNAYLGSELKLIEDYIERGGNLLWLRDANKQNYFTSLENLLGISTIPGVIIDANTKLRILLGIKHAAVIPVTEFYKHTITQGLESHLLFPFAAAMLVTDNNIWSANILFKSLERSWAEVGELNSDQLKYEQEFGDSQGPLTMGVALTRAINDKQQRVIVIGDSDFIANGYIGNGANFSLSLNLLNWLTQDDSLLSIKHQHAPDQSIELHDNDIIFIAIILLLIVPGLLISTGFLILWMRHRH